jgi:hypothetical protein
MKAASISMCCSVATLDAEQARMSGWAPSTGLGTPIGYCHQFRLLFVAVFDPVASPTKRFSRLRYRSSAEALGDGG